MANEKRLIDVEKAWKKAQRIYSDPVLLHAIKNTLDATETEDATPAAHCRKCEHLRSGKNNFGVFFWCGHAAGLTNIYDPDTDYCPRGARMDGS